MSDQATINRIKALLAKIEWKGCTEGEARLAWEKARQLSNKYKIRLDDLGIGSNAPDTTAGQYSARPGHHAHHSASPKAQRAANPQPADAELSDWARTLACVFLAAISGVLIYLALEYGPAVNQIARLSLWVAFLLCAFFSIAIFVDLMQSYDLTLLTLPSTWLMLLASILAIIFLVSHGVTNGPSAQPTTQYTHSKDCGKAPLDLARVARSGIAPPSGQTCKSGSIGHQTSNHGPDSGLFRGVFQDLTDGHVLLLAGLLVSTVLALITNIIKTNVIFGLLLSSVQLLFVTLLTIAAILLMLKLGSRNSDRSDGYSRQ